MIHASSISKSFNQLKVLNDVSLSVAKGEIVSIVGPSGAGKSTLLHILGTIDRPDTGNLLINDLDIFKMRAKKLADFRNKNIGFIFQFHHLLSEFTALENTAMPAFIGKADPVKSRRKAAELLEYLGLKDRMEHKPSELSGGEQQRVAVARALMNDPLVVLADEPTGNLDSQSALQLHDLFFKLRDQFNQTFIIVTHNEELAMRADRKIQMRDGKLEPQEASQSK